MALAFPLPLAAFFEGLKVRQVQFYLHRPRSDSIAADGSVIPHGLGAPHWRGTIELGVDAHAEIAAVEARIALLEQPGASLLLYDRRKPFPRYDPGGALLTSVPTISAVSPNNREIDLANLPAGYVIAQGDMIGSQYGTNPIRYALHRVVTGAMATGNGTAEAIEVTPVIRPGLAIGTPVELIRPACKAIVTSADYGHGRSVVGKGATIEWQQTLR